MTKGITVSDLKEARDMIYAASFDSSWSVTMTRRQYEEGKQLIDDYKKTDKNLTIHIIG